MKKEMTYTELAKETAILTAAVAIIAAAVYFFLVPDGEKYYNEHE